jgi:hypothetical protein
MLRVKNLAQLKSLAPAIYELHSDIDTTNDPIEIDTGKNDIVTPWAIDKLITLQELCDKYIIPGHIQHMWVFRIPKDGKGLMIPQFQEDKPQRMELGEYAKGLHVNFGLFFKKVEDDQNGPDGGNDIRGLNLKLLFTCANFLGNIALVNLIAARFVQWIKGKDFTLVTLRGVGAAMISTGPVASEEIKRGRKRGKFN